MSMFERLVNMHGRILPNLVESAISILVMDDFIAFCLYSNSCCSIQETAPFVLIPAADKKHLLMQRKSVRFWE